MRTRRGDSPSCEAWRLLFDLLMAQRSRVPTIAAEFGLSPMQCHVLRLLEPGEPAPMGRLAAGLACDASNITGIVDRLEARGLIERRPAARDRRVRVLALTESGAELRARILERMAEPPEWVEQLPAEEQQTLCRILRRARV
jgi:DNA-binding MarR family transcriptional regulator